MRLGAVSLAAFLAMAPAFAEPVPPPGVQTAEFSSGGLCGKVVAPAYEAVVDRSGSFVVNLRGGPTIKASFIRQWTAFQRFPQTRLVRMERSASTGKIDFAFRYSWDGGNVAETLSFGPRGVDASYVFTPDEDRDLRFTGVYLEPQGQEISGARYVAQEASRDSDNLLFVDASAKARERFSSLSLREAGPLCVDFLALGQASFTVESFPSILLHNRGRYGSWSTSYKAGQPLKISFAIFLSSKDARNLPDAALEFKESP
jgi:hypothetical protein